MHLAHPSRVRSASVPGAYAPHGMLVTPRRGRHAEQRMPRASSTDATSEAEAEALSDEYSEVMTERMGAPLTYRHEDGMNYDRILPDLIVGSCLQVSADVDTLAEREDVRTILCLQERSDQEYFSLDVEPIRERCRQRGGPLHLRHAIRDFDPFSLRRRLPSAVALLAREAAAAGGTAYVHCTAGLGRAPATALAYMWWVKGMPLEEATALLTGLRPCFPKIAAIRAAAADMLYGPDPVPVTLTMLRRGTASTVQVAGLDIGWGQKMAMTPDGKTGRLVLRRSLPPGEYQYKFIWDEQWGTCLDHPTILDGSNLNNLLVVPDPDCGPEVAAARARVRSEGGALTPGEAAAIREKLAALEAGADDTSAPGI